MHPIRVLPIEDSIHIQPVVKRKQYNDNPSKKEHAATAAARDQDQDQQAQVAVGRGSSICHVVAGSFKRQGLGCNPI
jgi:hypothetical protein